MEKKIQRFLFSLSAMLCLSLSAVADGDRGISGSYVIDANVTVPAGAYTTFSTVYNGKRYYLGIDTTAAKSGSDAVYAYDKPCYAAMWVVGGLYSPTGAVLDNKNYQRAIKSLWIEERCTDRAEGANKRYLALGSDNVTYTPVILADTAHATLWYTEKDTKATGQYILGFLYYMTDATGVDVYRYVTYDPMYGFSRAYESKPMSSQRISVWDRKTGSDVVSDLRVANATIGWETYGKDTTKIPITSHVYYYEGIDRFRSRYDQVDIIAHEPTVVDNQTTLLGEPYNLYGYYEWASNPRSAGTYNGASLMPDYTGIIDTHGSDNPEDWTMDMGWRDSTVMWVSDTNYKLANDIWYDTVYAIGSAPFDILRKPADGGAPQDGDYTDHVDWLRQHFRVKGEYFVDSIKLIRRTFHNAPYLTLNASNTPVDHVFPYFAHNASTGQDTLNGGTTATALNTTQSFTVSVDWEGGNRVLYANNALAYAEPPMRNDVNVANLRCIRDTLWVLDEDGNPVLDGGGEPTYSDIILYDSLIVEALLPDGVTNAIIGGTGANEDSWLQSVRLTAKNTIEVVAGAYNYEAIANRTAQIRYTYRYIRTMRKGDRSSVTRVIWLTQQWHGANDATLYTFHHKTGAGSTNLVDDAHPQQVHTHTREIYGIPGNMQLPIHHDHWGYYRWYEWNGLDASTERAVDHNKWRWVGQGPTNQQTPEAQPFMPINSVTDAASRGRWDIGGTYFSGTHFDKSQPTPIPSVIYPNSISHTDTLACDVSAYTDIAYEGEIGESLSSLTEPTLSYRNKFVVKPAKERADEMESCIGNGSAANWMEKRTVLVPKGRPFYLHPMSAVYSANDDEVEEEHLQYIYYFNTGNDGEDMGQHGTLDLTQGTSYSRVGVKRTVSLPKRLKVLSKNDLDAMSTGSTKKVLMVNPSKNVGYVVGRSGSEDMDYIDWTSQDKMVNDTADLREYMMTDERVWPNDYCVITLTKVNDGIITLAQNNYPLYNYWKGLSYTTHWISGSESDVTGEKMMSYVDFSSCSDAARISGCNYVTDDRGNHLTTLFKLHMNWEKRIIWDLIKYAGRTGYITACKWVDNWFSADYYEPDFQVIDGDGNSGSSAVNQGWMFYEILEEESNDYEEIPVWYEWNGSAWVEVARIGRPTADYSMLTNGSLHITNPNIFTAKNQTKTFCLRTQHFQLAKFTVVSRDPDEEGPKDPSKDAGTILSEDVVQQEYDILYKLDMEDWVPGTSNVHAYNAHLDWDMTELAYHYPMSVIPVEQRVDTASAVARTTGEVTYEMPVKGQYAFINKFIVPAAQMNATNVGAVVESRAGAEHGYMLCINAPRRRSMFMSFEFNRLSCSGQQIYFTADICNPVNNSYAPEITMDMEGRDGNNWVPIYRFKTGEIPFNSEQPWTQIVLPISRDSIMKYSSFRCRAELNGGPNKNCYVLIDRMRFIERSRAFTVFQNKATCVEDDSVTTIIRLDYREDPDLYHPGELVAFQFQKWDNDANGGEGGYVAMQGSSNNGDGNYTRLPKNATEVYPGYFKDGFTAAESVETPTQKTLAGNDYGFVLIPEANYDPSASNTVGGQSALRSALIEQIITKLGLTGSAADAHRAMLDETACIRTFDEVLDQDYDDFGTYDNPHIKSFVNEGTPENPYWVLYIICRLPTTVTDNNSFRIGMAMMNDLNDMPTFTDDACATYRAIQVKQVTSLKVDGKDWTNHTRAELIESGGLLPANDTYRASIALNIESKMAGNTTANPRCKFDLLHTSADVRAIGDAASEAAFAEKYGCTRTQFMDAMETFRTDDERNTVRDEYDWSKVKPVDFTSTGRSLENATEIYNRLNRLISGGLLELGLDYRDIYMGDRADSYFYLLPIPASGQFDVINGNLAGTADTTLHASVCNDTLWLELHSEEPTAKLRYGYDSRIGDTFIVPVIRASKTAANSSLPVRVAEIMTTNEAYALVLGWAATELIESNDPKWSDIKTFKYTQDKNMIGQTPASFDYYAIGDNITFTPNAGNLYELRAGYWYRFRTPFYTALKAETYTADPVEATGHTLFTVAVAPDTVRWAPSHPDKANYWNDDANWTAIVNGSEADDVIAKVPMGDSRVIIPQVAEGLLPIVADVVVDQKDTLEFGYTRNTCSDILFKTRSQILGQEKLNYTRAFVDVQLTSGSWQTFTPALKHIYAGDMYIPANAETTDASDFLPGRFTQGDGEVFVDNPRIWPYAVYQGFYNSSVPIEFYNTDENDLPVASNTATSKSSVDWVATNKIDMPYRPGAVSVLNAYGPSDEDGETLVIRLPKQENAYRGYGRNPSGGAGYVAGPEIVMGEGNPKVERPTFDNLEHNLAYDRTSLGESDGITYNLHNEIASEIFFFGNPTMSLIDVYRLCLDNSAVLQHSDGTYRFTAYQLLDGSSYTVRTITGEGQYFIAPQRAVGLIANAPANDLSIRLTPRAMVALTGDGTIVNDPMAASAPVRRATAATDDDSRYLYIAAATATIDEWGGESVSRSYITLGESTEAHRGYIKGEDAPSIASGESYYSAETFHTPLSIYTIADNEALMLDMRDTLSGVPLVFTTLDEQYTFGETTLLSFAMAGDWQQPLYLYDAVSGDSALIVSGKQIAVRTPLSNQIRYFINGKRAPQSTNQTDIATDVAYGGQDNGTTPDSPTADSSTTHVYDMLGRCVYTPREYELLDLSGLPAGVYLIRRGNTTERRVLR